MKTLFLTFSSGNIKGANRSLVVKMPESSVILPSHSRLKLFFNKLHRLFYSATQKLARPERLLETPLLKSHSDSISNSASSHKNNVSRSLSFVSLFNLKCTLYFGALLSLLFVHSAKLKNAINCRLPLGFQKTSKKISAASLFHCFSIQIPFCPLTRKNLFSVCDVVSRALLLSLRFFRMSFGILASAFFALVSESFISATQNANRKFRSEFFNFTCSANLFHSQT